MSMFRLFMPKVVAPSEVEQLKSSNAPSFTRVLLPNDAQFLGCQTIPTLEDALGLGSGKVGPPGFGFWVPDERAPVFPRLLTFMEPDKSFSFDGLPATVVPLGFVTFLALTMGVIEIGSNDMAAVEAMLQSAGAVIRASHAYIIPEELKQMAFSRPRTDQIFSEQLANLLKRDPSAG